MKWTSRSYPSDDLPRCAPVSTKNFIYRTEMYLQQREEEEQQRVKKSPITTWKNVKYQKHIFQDEQAEIDRVLSTIDSIHGTFNRSLLMLNNDIYSSLYGDDHVSTHLMKTFCQRQDYYINYHLSIKDNDRGHTRDFTNLFDHYLETDSDPISDDEKEQIEYEKKNSYDSAYGSVRPSRQLSRESLLSMN